MSLTPGLQVVRSAIHGYGVVATKRFARGELVLEGEGVLYDADADFDDTYALIFDGDTMVPPQADHVFYDLVCQSRWINHACEPNTQVESRWDETRKAPIAQWFATRDIEVGQELTYDYAFAAEVAEPCGCGMPSCRGLIVDPSEISQVDPVLAKSLRR